MRPLYDIAVYAYRAGISAAAPFNPKASSWALGRKGLFNDLRGHFQSRHNTKTIWFHCASLGEFEQGRPVIDAFREKRPGWTILVTFFSPSGYEIRKGYEGADIVSYLPMDTPANARKFLDIVNPSIAVFIKYEFWYNYMSELYKRDIPFVYFSTIFRERQHFFKWYGGWFRKKLALAEHIFVQDERSRELLEKTGIKKVSIAGDTRFDRVRAIADKAVPYPPVEKFRNGRKLLLAGSTWPRDEDLIAETINNIKGLKVIIAPHETDNNHIREIEKKFSGLSVTRLSTLENEEDPTMRDILVIDSIGHLMHLYKYCDIAYIGGGFGAGIHNILEAATFGKPVIFGPNYQKFREARELIGLGGAFTVDNAGELSELAAKFLSDDDLREKASTVAEKYVTENTGATGRITRHLLELSG